MFTTLCIPRAFPNITEARVQFIFDELDIGHIHHTDIINTVSKTGEKFNRIFVHFDEWYKNENATRSLEQLQKGKELKIIYDDPWFWKVSLYYKPEKPVKKSIRIDFGPDEFGRDMPRQLEIAPCLQIAPSLQFVERPPQKERQERPPRQERQEKPPRQEKERPPRQERQERPPRQERQRPPRQERPPRPPIQEEKEEGEVFEEKETRGGRPVDFDDIPDKSVNVNYSEVNMPSRKVIIKKHVKTSKREE
jgi:hypothetical protein